MLARRQVIPIRTFETDDVPKMHDAAVPVHLPGVVTFNSESERASDQHVKKMYDAAVPVHLPGDVTFNSESETGWRTTGNDSTGRP